MTGQTKLVELTEREMAQVEGGRTGGAGNDTLLGNRGNDVVLGNSAPFDGIYLMEPTL